MSHAMTKSCDKSCTRGNSRDPEHVLAFGKYSAHYRGVLQHLRDRDGTFIPDVVVSKE